MSNSSSAQVWRAHQFSLHIGSKEGESFYPKPDPNKSAMVGFEERSSQCITRLREREKETEPILVAGLVAKINENVEA